MSVSEMTPDRLRELRRIAEAATPGKRVVFVPEGRRGHEWFILQVDGSVRSVITVINKWARNMSTVDYCDADAEFFATFDQTTVLALLDEIERLRWERETLAAAVMGWQRYLERDVGTEIVHVRTLEAHGRAIALIDGRKGGDDDA